MKKSTCQCCKGKGGYFAKILNETQYVPCDFPGCHNGIVDREENQRIINIDFNAPLKEEIVCIR